MTAERQHAAQSSPDLTCAWLYAANCSLYEDDDGPAQLNIASHLEPHFVSRVEAFRDLYSRLLLEALDADAARIAALARDIDTAPRNNPIAAVVWDIAGRAVPTGGRRDRQHGGRHRCSCPAQTARRNQTSQSHGGAWPVDKRLPATAGQ
jgi:hypothetical protein